MKLLIASDIHANTEPLKQALKDVEYDFGIFLGDIVDYGTRPSEAIDLVRDNFDRSVQGNHDNAAAFGVDCLCGQENHELSVYTREEITMHLLNGNDLKYLQSLDTSSEFELEGVKINIAHGSPRNTLHEYVYPWGISQDMFTSALGSRVDADIFLLGHTHYQFFSQIRGSIIINPGSIGQPRDMDPRPSFCLYDTETGNAELKRVDYDKSVLKEEIKQMLKDTRMRDLDLKLFRLY